MKVHPLIRKADYWTLFYKKAAFKKTKKEYLFNYIRSKKTFFRYGSVFLSS